MVDLTAAPTPPSLNDPATFNARAIAFLGWIANNLVPEIEGLNSADWFDILGAVGQSGGVPTGALFEYGSNANGSYVRFADGTQICWNGSVPYQSSSSGNVTVNLPAAFIDNSFSAFAQSSDYAGALRVGSVAGYSSSSFLCSIFDSSGTRQADYFRWVAIGRWF